MRIHRKINQLHQSLCHTCTSSTCLYILQYTTQNNPWICRYRFNGIFFFDFFCIAPRTRKIKKKYSRVSYIHVSKNILKMIKQRNQARQVLFYSTLQVYQRLYSQVGHIPPKMSDKFESQYSLSPTIWSDVRVDI